MAKKLSMLFDFSDLLLNDDTLRHYVQLKPLQVIFLIFTERQGCCCRSTDLLGISLLFQLLSDLACQLGGQ